MINTPINQGWTEQVHLDRVYDVAIVGAGVAGSTLAVALANQGWAVILFERDQFPRHKVCGEFLSPESQQSLAALGLATALRAQQPVPLDRATITSASGHQLKLRLPGTAWGLSRFALDATLATHAMQAGAVLHSETVVTGYTLCDQGYQLNFRQGQRAQAVKARAVIMACGRHSGQGLPPRPALRQTEQHGWRRCVGVKAHFQGVQMAAQTELYLFRGGYVGINPVEGGVVNVCALLDYATFAAAGKAVLPAMQTMISWNDALGARLDGATPLLETACAVAPVDTLRQAQPWAKLEGGQGEGVACVGDTAAMIPPLCGDGMAMALRSAELCAPLADDFLRGRRSLAAWCQAYTSAWHHEFDQRLRLGQSLQRALGTPYLGTGLLWLGRLAPPVASYFVNATRG